MKLHHKIYGNAEEAVVIVHGLFGMLDNWHNIAKQLSDTYKVVTVDVRNHGNSPHSPDMDYDYMANDLNELLDDLGISSAHFVGHSMGGKIVMKVADLFPHRVDKLCIVDIAPKRYNPGHLELFDAMFSLDLETISSRSEIDEALIKKIPNTAIRLFLTKNIQRDKSGGFQWKMNLSVIFDAYQEIIGAIELAWPFSGETLVMRGERSDYITDEDMSDIEEMFPNSRLVTITGAGHWLHADNPDGFLSELKAFLTDN